jgi:hypothetical protein
MIEVFKTNVTAGDASKMLIQKILLHFPLSDISFDLEDCDKILRIEGNRILPDKVIAIIIESGFHCEVLQ